MHCAQVRRLGVVPPQIPELPALGGWPGERVLHAGACCLTLPLPLPLPLTLALTLALPYPAPTCVGRGDAGEEAVRDAAHHVRPHGNASGHRQGSAAVHQQLRHAHVPGVTLSLTLTLTLMV